MAIGYAVLSGAVFSFTTLNINYAVRELGFPADQLNFDGNMLYGLVMLPLYLKHCGEFSTKDVLMSNANGILSSIAYVFYGFALKYGQGANVQAIAGMNSVVQTVIVAIIVHRMPNHLEITGLIVGLSGVCIMIL